MTTIVHNRLTGRITRRIASAALVVGLIATATACGGDDSSASDAETQALIAQILDAARNGASGDQLADLLGEVDPEILEQAIPRIEEELDITIPEIVDLLGEVDPEILEPADPAAPQGGESDPADPAAPQGGESDAGSNNGSGPIVTLPGGASLPGLATPSLPSTTNAPVVTLPGGASIPGLGTPSLPSTTKAPVVTLPGGASIPGLGTPSLPSTSAPANTTVTFDLVQLNDRSDSKFLQVILSVDSVGKPAFVDLNYDSLSGALTRRLSLNFEQQMDPNTSLWTLVMRSDTDPCSLRFTIIDNLMVNTKGITLYKQFMGC